MKETVVKLPMRRAILSALLVGLIFVYSGAQSGTSVMTAAVKRELPVYNVEMDQKVIAISFDAAWGSANTKSILDILDRYDVKTTFFLVGFWAEKYPELVRELIARGHEIGNHSATHPHMAQLTDAKIREELNRQSELVRSITGQPTTLFRPPYGEYNDAVIRIAREEGFVSVQWSVDSLDWKNISAEDMVRRASKAGSGDIVLFHNDSKYILDALPQILEYYTQAGYKIVPVSQILLEGDTWIDHAGMQHASTPAPGAA